MAAPSILLGPSFATAERARDRTPTGVPALRRRAALVGTCDHHVSSLLTDVLRDIHLDVELLDEYGEAPDVVLAMVDSGDGVRFITEARARFPRVPVVAILTLGTHRLGTRAVAAGAQACFLLDMPIDRLRGILSALLKAPATDDKAKPRSGR